MSDAREPKGEGRPHTRSGSAAPAGHVVGDQSEVFAFLGAQQTHGLDAGAHVTRIDTHGAAVFLAGAFAYKVKRAVLFAFMDFSTLEKRHAACRAEVEIGARSAPGLYLAVAAIVRRDGALVLATDGDAAGEVLDYAVKMRRFPADATLDHVAARGALDADLLARLARAVGASHAAAPVVRGRDTVAAFSDYLADHRTEFSARPDLFPPAQAARLLDGMDAALERLAPLLTARSEAGYVRRCHGDLHLRNIVLFEGAPVLFDAIEFNAGIATCDVLYDLAFLLMDLWQRGLTAEANSLFNRYLWARDDDAGLDGIAALPFFLAMRAAIRAKVEAAGLDHLAQADRPAALARVSTFFSAALHFMDGVPATGPRSDGDLTDPDLPDLDLPDLDLPPHGLLAIGGLSGSGKTTRALALAPGFGRPPGAVIVRSDVERKRAFHTPLAEKLPQAAYGAEVTQEVYARMGALARRVLATGQSVILDAVHARPEERALAEDVARACGVPFRGVWLEAPRETLIARVDRRRGDASDADADVVRRQLSYDLGPLTWARRDSR